MEPIQKNVSRLEEGDVIQGVGVVTGVVIMASGMVVDVHLDALDGKMVSIAWEPTWRGLDRHEDGTYHGTGWEWPTVPVVPVVN